LTDGTKLCASLDRNGLRPSRYKITDDDILLYIGSEAGAVIFDDATIVGKGRLGPGQMISANTATGEFKYDRQIKEELAQQKPYRRWIDENRVELRKFVSPAAHVPEIDFSPLDLSRQQVVHGISLEELDMVFPPIDPIREWAVMSLGVGLGPERNLLVETPKHYNTVSLDSAILFEHQLEKIKDLDEQGFPSLVIDCTWPVSAGAAGMKTCLDELCLQAESAVQENRNILILSDCGTSAERVPIPMLLAIGTIHHHLNRIRKRLRASLVIESGETRDVHQIACCFGFGATAICPYLGYATVRQLVADESLIRHKAAFETVVPNGKTLNLGDPGYNRYRKAGERHVYTTEVIKNFHTYVKSGKPEDYDEYVCFALETNPVAIKYLIEFVPSSTGPIPLEEVEPMESIRRRFTTAAMSLGTLSPEAHETLAIAMNRIGGKSDSGEGGEDPVRHKPYPNGDFARSYIKQVASGRFGVSAYYLVNAGELEIKMAQGAKPGEGGQLPGHKVNALIARLRNTQPGVQLISPPPHHDIYSIEDLAQLIHDLKEVNPRG
jgi:hypothetical protein